MTDPIDRIFFSDLAELDPADVCRRASCGYDDVDDRYTLSVWGEPYAVFPSRAKIECRSDHARHPHEYFSLFTIHYLLTAKGINPTGEWISEKDIPGGSVFFRGPHAVPTNRITHRFENHVDRFRQRCEEHCGIPLDLADAAYCFEITPRIPVAVLYWAGDEDFPAEAKILYDRTISRHLALDVVYALAVGICERLAGS